ncbi:hypothetical protein ABFS83_11G033200 [Erythranthe nasuta]
MIFQNYPTKQPFNVCVYVQRDRYTIDTIFVCTARALTESVIFFFFFSFFFLTWFSLRCCCYCCCCRNCNNVGKVSAVMIILFNNSSEPGPYLGGAARMAFYLQPVVLFAAMAWPDSPALITDLSLKFNYYFF